MSKQPSTHSDPIKARYVAERLRLLYSWRESLNAGGAPLPRVKAAADRLATREIAAARQQAHAEIERLAGELQNVLAAEQRRRGNLVIEEKLGQIRHEIGQFNWLFKAESSAGLGGMVELPLEHYPVELGLHRPLAGLQMERDDFITLGAAAIFIVASCLAITWYHLWREDVTFSLDRPGPRQIAVIFRNDSSFVASFYGPWPDSDAGLEKHGYGVRLYARSAGSDSFQECTSIREAWSYQGQPISPLKPIQVESGVTVTVLLDIPTLKKVYGDTVGEVRITCGNRHDRGDFSFTESL